MTIRCESVDKGARYEVDIVRKIMNPDDLDGDRFANLIARAS